MNFDTLKAQTPFTAYHTYYDADEERITDTIEIGRDLARIAAEQVRGAEEVLVVTRAVRLDGSTRYHWETCSAWWAVRHIQDGMWMDDFALDGYVDEDGDFHNYSCCGEEYQQLFTTRLVPLR